MDSFTACSVCENLLPWPGTCSEYSQSCSLPDQHEMGPTQDATAKQALTPYEPDYRSQEQIVSTIRCSDRTAGKENTDGRRRIPEGRLDQESEIDS